MTDYTKGEWKATKSPIGDWVIATDDTLICREARHFNAHLISAAPDMYEALKRFLESSACKNGCDPDDMTCDTNFARKALAKAEGK